MTGPSRLRSEVRFGMVPLWLIESDVSDRAVRLYVLLHGRWADRDGHAWPSRKTLARALHCAVSSVDRAKDELVEAGALTVEKRNTSQGDYDVNLYTLIMKRNGGVAPPVTPPLFTGEEGGSRTGAATVAARVTPEPDPSEPDLETGGGTGMATNYCAVKGCRSETTREIFFCAEHMEAIPEDLKGRFRRFPANLGVPKPAMEAVMEARALIGEVTSD